MPDSSSLREDQLYFVSWSWGAVDHGGEDMMVEIHSNRSLQPGLVTGWQIRIKVKKPKLELSYNPQRPAPSDLYLPAKPESITGLLPGESNAPTHKPRAGHCQLKLWYQRFVDHFPYHWSVTRNKVLEGGAVNLRGWFSPVEGDYRRRGSLKFPGNQKS